MNKKQHSKIVSTLNSDSNFIDELINRKINALNDREIKIKYLGKGTFSKVYEISKTTVIKAFSIEGNEDTIKYLEYSKKNHINNLYLPKVYDIIQKSNQCIVLMEKLFTKMNDADAFIKRNITYFSKDWTEIRLHKDCPKDFRTVVEKLRRIRRENKRLIYDFHDENILFRLTGKNNFHPVIADPIYDKDALYKTKNIGIIKI